MKFELPELPYNLNALEPFVSEKALELHRYKHHQAYLTKLNDLIKRTKFEDLDLENIIKIADGPVYNNAAQAWNHTFYFESLKAGKPILKGPFAEVIKRNFGSISFFKTTFIKAVVSLHDVGWIWLVLNPKASLEIIQMSNAGNPLRTGLVPLLVCDVWEHAYYLDYQDRLQEYFEAFWNLINWEVVEDRYNEFT